MKKVFKKLTAVLLAAVMAVGMLSVNVTTVMAGEIPSVEIDISAKTNENAPITISGSALNNNYGLALDNPNHTISISAAAGYNLYKVEATVSHAHGNPVLAASAGTLDKTSAKKNEIITITDINGDTVTLSNTSTDSLDTIKFKHFKVYYQSVTTFGALQELIDNTPNGGTLTLEKDYTYDSSVIGEPSTITINKTITLDLNGHTISGGDANDNSVITINQGATLILKDSSADGTGTITGGNTGDIGGGVRNGGTFVMQGGTISENTASGTTSTKGGAGVYNSGTFEMQGGTISSNKAGNQGGGVYNVGMFIMNGGKISNNAAINGGGVQIKNGGTFNMNGGEISGNTLSGSITKGGGVDIYKGTFTMTGGEISGNTASQGGGVQIRADGTFNMTGGEISGNSGAGVDIQGTFKVGGTAKVSGNKKGSSDADNVYLLDGKTITISSTTALTTGAYIGVNTKTAPAKGSPVTISGTITSDYSSYFTSDNSDYKVKFNTDHLELAIAKEAITPSVSLEGWTYGDTAKDPSVTGNTGSGQVTYSYKVKDANDSTYSTTVPTDAGTYTVKADIAETDDYLSGSCTADFTIAKAKVAVPTAVTGLVYNGEEQTLVILPDDAPYTTTNKTSATNAGLYDVTLTLSDKDNYEWNLGTPTSDDQIIEVIIAKADPDVTAPAAVEGLTYKGSAQSLVTAGSTVDGTLNYSLDGENWSEEIPKATDAGTYSVYYKVTRSINHRDTEVLGPVSVSIAKKQIVIPTAAEGLVYNGTEQIGVIYSEIFSTVGVYTMSGTTKTDYAGDYKAFARLDDTDNYEWEDGTTANKTIDWSIARKPITISWGKNTFEYDGKAHLPQATASDANAEIVTDPSDGYTAVGNYSVTATLAPGSESENNYTITSGATCKFSITKNTVNSVIKKISAIGTVKYTNASKAKIDAARKAYNALSAAQKKLVTAKQLKVLTAAEAKYAQLKAAAIENAQKQSNKIVMSSSIKVSSGKEIKLSWGKAKYADGYNIYMGYCGDTATLVKSTKSTSLTINKLGGKAINQKKNIKYYIVAYKLVNGKKVAYGQTLTMHIAGSKNTSVTNAKKITVSKSTYTLAKGKTATITAKTVKANSKLKLIAHTAEFRYATSNSSVATVSADGKITAKSAGTCTIYIYAANGISRKVTVTVK